MWRFAESDPFPFLAARQCRYDVRSMRCPSLEAGMLDVTGVDAIGDLAGTFRAARDTNFDAVDLRDNQFTRFPGLSVSHLRLCQSFGPIGAPCSARLDLPLLFFFVS